MVFSDAALGQRVVCELSWQPSNVFILGHPLGSHLLPAAGPPSMLLQILNEGCRGGESQAPLFTWAPLGGSSCSVSLGESPGRGDGLPGASVTLSDTSLGHCLQGPALRAGRGVAGERYLGTSKEALIHLGAHGFGPIASPVPRPVGSGGGGAQDARGA